MPEADLSGLTGGRDMSRWERGNVKVGEGAMRLFTVLARLAEKG